jgi:hypothetical protein
MMKPFIFLITQFCCLSCFSQDNKVTTISSAAQKTPVLNASPLQVVSSVKTDSMKTDSMNVDNLSVKVNPSYISTIPSITNVTLVKNSDEKSQTPAPINKTYVMPTFKTADEVQKYLLENNMAIEPKIQE